MKHIYAYTPPGAIDSGLYVEFISISEKSNGNLRISIRQRSEHPAPHALMDMPREELVHMIDALKRLL